MAHTGTLLLDEVGTLPARPPAQAPAGPPGARDRAGRGRACDPRSTSASSPPATRDLRQAVAAGRFREDLFYRLHVVPIAVPPLRERREDVAPLARHFLAKYARQFGKPVTDLSPGALAALERYHWPGNVRELENIIARSVALTSEPVVQLDQIPLDVALAPVGGHGRGPAQPPGGPPRGRAAPDPARPRPGSRQPDGRRAAPGDAPEHAAREARPARAPRSRAGRRSAGQQLVADAPEPHQVDQPMPGRRLALDVADQPHEHHPGSFRGVRRPAAGSP